MSHHAASTGFVSAPLLLPNNPDANHAHAAGVDAGPSGPPTPCEESARPSEPATSVENLLGDDDGDGDGGQGSLYAALHPPPSPGKDFRVLGMWSVVALTWFNVSGGAFGSEEIVSAGGPAYGFLTLLALTVLWAVPVACMTAELSTAFPNDGGYSLWVKEAFGGFWGYQESYWSWISGVTDNAVYPVLVFDSCAQYLWGSSMSWWMAYCVKLGLVVLFSLPNLFSVELAGNGMILMMLVVTLPFLLLTLCAVPRLSPASWVETMPWHDVDWNVLINTTFWSINGFDCASTFAGEVRSPDKTFPKAMLLAVVAVFLTNLLPLAAAVSVNEPRWETWTDGSFTTIADGVAGKWLGFLMVACSVVSSMGLYGAELFEDSFQLMGMAQTGMFPRFFAKRSHYGTPMRAVMASVVLICILIMFDFTSLVVIQNFLYCLAVCLEITTCVHLRLRRPDLRRPKSRVVLPLCLFAVPLVVSGGMVVLSLTVDVQTTAINLAALSVGVLLYAAQQRWNRRQAPL